jgi:hypothetical protein
MTDADIAANARSYPAVFKSGGFQELLNRKIQKSMKLHSRYYGPIHPQPGELFNGYPVARFTRFNGKDVYEVDYDNWKGTRERGSFGTVAEPSSELQGSDILRLCQRSHHPHLRSFPFRRTAP